MTALSGDGMNLVGHYFPEGGEQEAEAAVLAKLRKITADPIVMAAQRTGLADFLLGDNPTGWSGATPIQWWWCAPD